MPVTKAGKGFRAVRKEIESAVHASSNAAAVVLAVEVSRLLDQPGSGITYRSKRPGGGTHTASAPGEPPARDTGGLQDAIEVKRVGRIESDVVVNHPAALGLEYGRRDGSILPRPYMRPARKNVKTKMREAARDALRGANPPGLSATKRG